MVEVADLTLYVVRNCPLCSHAKSWLETHAIPYVERDVADDWGALRVMVKLTHQRLVPVVEYGGRAMVRPSDDELKDLVSRAR